MKNLFRLIGIIATITVIGFIMVACEDDPAEGDALAGTTWRANFEGDNFSLTFSSGSTFTMVSSEGTVGGTYSISGSAVTLYYGGDQLFGTLAGNTILFSGSEVTFIKQ
ncbi:MAG: hypothetical protein LBQ82_02480, partial [Treponema sp.]|nr:hypothetical protein [Treponema sp.]